jgi:hypothetical protein
VINERDILGTQLIRRNDELALLYEKIKIQQSTLSKGQIQYRDRYDPVFYTAARCMRAVSCTRDHIAAKGEQWYAQ